MNDTATETTTTTATDSEHSTTTGPDLEGAEDPLAGLPRPRVKLTGTNGNAFAVVGHVSKALRKAGWTSAQVTAFTHEAFSGDYAHVLGTCTKYAEVR